MAPTPTDMVLVRSRVGQADGLPDAARRFCAEAGLQLRRLAWSGESGWCYLYAQPGASAVQEPARLVPLWTGLVPQAQDTDASRLQLAQDLPGRSHGDAATRHYVVETDPEAGWEEELARWYVQEHMPGLAAVPGCIHARRYLNPDAGPGSHACYELVTQDTLGSPAWLAVRHTDWSSRVRPHFTNTRRTMMQVLL